jgi:hypothetical protein
VLRTHVYALGFGVWVANGEVVEVEHAVEWLGEELELCLVRQHPTLFLTCSYAPVYNPLSV